MPRTDDSPDALALWTADRQRWLNTWRELLNNPAISPETKAEIVTETASAMRQIADIAGFYA